MGKKTKAETEMKVVTTRIPKDLYLRLKRRAVEEETTIQRFFTQALEDRLKKK